MWLPGPAVQRYDIPEGDLWLMVTVSSYPLSESFILNTFLHRYFPQKTLSLQADYEDYIQTRHLNVWDSSHSRYKEMLAFCRFHNRVQDYKP